MQNKWLDLGERVGATAVEAGIGVAAVDLGHLYPAYAVLLAAVAAAVKNAIGHLIGDKSNGSWLPSTTVDNPVDSVDNAPPLVIGG